MPKYVVEGFVTISAFAYVEADSAEEAKSKAVRERGMPELCHGCTDAGVDHPDECWILNGFDDFAEALDARETE